MSAQGLMSSSAGMEEETKLVQKQGIVTILSSDCERNRCSPPPSSLRRTLSADMSSKKWLSQNGFLSTMKKTFSSQKLSHSETIIAAVDLCSSSSDSESSDDCEERKALEAESTWSAIQQDKNKESERPGAFDIWSSIVSQKTNDDASKSSLPPPYIHPLVKRSQSSLSEKSLEICTESLGSETGSDVFSSYPPSETGETEEDKDDEEEETEKETLQEQYHEPEEDDFVVPKFNYSATSKKAGPRSFPPPLPSLTRQDGPAVHMRSRRENGRLVLEAVSVPSQNNFCARRQDGRLLLTFNNIATNEEFQHDEEEEPDEEEYDVDVEEMEEEFGEFEKDEEEEENEHEEEDDDEEREEEEIDKSDGVESAPILSSRVESVYRLGLTMNKPIGFVNRNPRWPEKLNEVVNPEDIKVVEKTTTTAKSSLPPRPRAAARSVPSAVSSFNPYEYFWRAKSTDHPQNNSSLKNNGSGEHMVCEAINQTPQEQQKLLVLRGKNGYLVHNWRSCKESRRSLLFREPHCIATS